MDAPSDAQTNISHVAALDALRGIAILGVLALHVSTIIPNLGSHIILLSNIGTFGVQLFFVVSGYTLMVRYRREPIGIAFYTRRFFRIAPMFYLGAIFYLWLGFATDLPFAPKNASLSDIALTLSFLHGWRPDTINFVVPGGWSIAAEAAFYLLFPLILSANKKAGRLAFLTLATYLASPLVMLGLRMLAPTATSEVNSFSYFFWLTQLPAFLIGCMLMPLVQERRLPTAATTWLGVGSLGGAALLLFAALAASPVQYFIAVPLCGLFTAWVLLRQPRAMDWAPLCWLGRISFSMYIVHFAVIGAVGYALRPILDDVPPPAGLSLHYLVSLAATIPLAAATYRWVERPMIRLGSRVFPSRSKRPGADHSVRLAATER